MSLTWLVFDIGTGSAKAALIRDGQILQSASAAYETAYGDDGVVEQDADDWWAAVQRSCRALDLPGDLAGIVLTGQMQDVVLLDEAGTPLRPVMLYSDTRARVQIARIQELVSAAELVSITGLRQNAGSLLAKLRWLREHEPQRLAAAAHLLFGGADYVAARMTGNYLSDNTTASTTGLWDLAAGRLLGAPLLTRMELEWVSSILPPVAAGGARAGVLTEAAAKVLGLTPGTPVYLGPGDAGSATIGAGCGEAGPAYAYVGTSGWVGFSAPEIGAAAAGVMTLAHPKDGHFIQVVPMMTSAGNLDWLQGIFSGDTHEAIICQALRRTPSDLIFLPYLHGERAPFNDPFARGAFIGISGGTERADLYRAVLEGMIFAYRHTLTALSPQLPAALTLVGGGARDSALNQLFADIIAVPVHLPPDAKNVGLFGALRAVEVSLGISPDYAIPPSPETQILLPNSHHRELYERKYQHFRAAYQALKPLFQQMSG